jgi:single-stranded-DNA-specific exonuclease
LLYQAEEQLHSQPDWQNEKLIFLAGQYWNPGLIGLVASDLAEKILSSDGAARRGRRVSVAPRVAAFRDLTSWKPSKDTASSSNAMGGHSMAAGFSIRTERLPLLKERLCAYAREVLRDLEDPLHDLETELCA